MGRKTWHGRRKTGCDGTYCLEALRRSNGFSLTQVKDELEGCPSVLAAPLDSDEAARLAACFSALDVPVRLRILSVLAAPPKAKSVWEFHRTHRQEPRRHLPPPEDPRSGRTSSW